jgi:REP-associated tyrosine transposase
MTRMTRMVAPGLAHHVSQCGANRRIVFCPRWDRKVYLELLRENALRGGVRILACCRLMVNPIHLIAVTEEENSLAVTLRRTPGRDAQYFNARRLRSGHNWQNRFFS